MNMSTHIACRPHRGSRRDVRRLFAAVFPALFLLALVPLLRADVVILDDDFNDPSNNLGTNTLGIGDGFTSFMAGGNANAFAGETNDSVVLSSSVNGASRNVFDSIDTIPLNVNGTRFEFRGVSFTNQVNNNGAPNTDRVLLALQDNSRAGDWLENGMNNAPNGFWLQIMSDSEATSTGNGAWTGTSALFYKDPSGTRTELASWVFDNLRWTATGPTNFTPVLNISLTLSDTTWALNITGDTQGGGSPISFSGTYAAVGITNVLLNGLEGTYVGGEDQSEGPGITMSVDRVVVTQLGTLIVPTPMFLTPEYGFNTNQVRAGEALNLVSPVIDTAGTPTLQWQIENSATPGTFTNLLNGTSTNVAVDTTALGDSVARGLRLIATDGGNSVTSAVVTLTVGPGVAPQLDVDIQPAGPTNVVNVGLSFSYSAAVSGNLPITNQWQKSPDAVTWTNIPNATNTTLLIPSAAFSDAGFYRFVATNLFGFTNSSTNYLAVTNGNPKFHWQIPVNFTGLNRDQILTNFPGTKLAGALYANGGRAVQTTPPTGISPISFAPDHTWASIVGGNGYGAGAFPGTNTTYTTTGSGAFNAALNNIRFDGGPQTIFMSNLVVGQQYSLQLFALDGRNLTSPGGDQRTVNWQDPADPTDVSITYAMVPFTYVVGTFYASNTVESVQENILNTFGNFDCLVLRAVGWNPPPYVTGQPVGATAYTGDSAFISGASFAGDSTIPNPAITVHWQAGPPGGPYTNLVEGTKYNGTTTGTLTINNAGAADTTLAYVVVASNGGGSTTTAEATLTLVAPTPSASDLLGHWLTGTASLNDTANFVAPDTFDGVIVSNGVVGSGGNFYFTNDVPPGAPSGAMSLFLFGNNTAVIISNTASGGAYDPGYTNTFDDVLQTNGFSVAFWAKGWPGQWNPWLSKWGESGTGYQFRQNGNSQNFPCWTIRGTGGTVVLGNPVFGNPEDMASTTISLGTSQNGNWHYYTGTYDTNGFRKLYVDGVLAAEETGNGPFTLPTTAHLMIGARDNNGTINSYFTGNLYDVRIYDYPLSVSQIRTVGRFVPTLTQKVTNGNQLLLTWPFGTLQSATNLLGPWTAVPGAAAPDTILPLGTQTFFRVSNP